MKTPKESNLVPLSGNPIETCWLMLRSFINDMFLWKATDWCLSLTKQNYADSCCRRRAAEEVDLSQSLRHVTGYLFTHRCFSWHVHLAAIELCTLRHMELDSTVPGEAVEA